MKIPFHLLAILLGFLPLVSPGQEVSSPTNQEARLAEWLIRYPDSDANGDGVLTREEAIAFLDELKEAERPRRPSVPPTRADIRYGEHERQVFDLWLPEKLDFPAPVHVFFHGGGFVAGDKAGFDPTPFLEAGFAAVSGNYRFVDGSATLCPTPMEDAARVIQTLRHRSEEWKIDPDRISVGGSSAGAVISLWIGYHDDLADPESADPIARESTRVACITPLNGPTNLRPDWIRTHLGGPYHIHGSLPKMFGRSWDKDQPEILDRIKASNPWDHLSADDPPTLLVYVGKQESMPLAESVSTGHLVHHPQFGTALKQRLDELEIENELHTATDPRGTSLVVDWVRARHEAQSQSR